MADLFDQQKKRCNVRVIKVFVIMLLELSFKVVLASASPRRKEILEEIISDFLIVPADIDETIQPDWEQERIAEELASLKAAAIAKQFGDQDCIIGADTIVVLNGQVLGKPEGQKEAIEMLTLLQGSTHNVYTGICLLYQNQCYKFTECTGVTFRSMEAKEIGAYINEYKPYDKAGAYGIQDWVGTTVIEEIHGSYTNVKGLPSAPLYKKLKGLNNAGN